MFRRAKVGWSKLRNVVNTIRRYDLSRGSKGVRGMRGRIEG